MRSSTTPCHKTPTAAYTYSPSVPLSLYRELAVQLQAAEARLYSLNAQNQHLSQHNQQLHQEIEKAVQAVLHLQQITNYSPHSPGSGYSRQTRPPNSHTVNGPVPIREPSPVPKKIYIEQQEGRYRRRSQPETIQVNGWSLAIAILLIIFTAFGAGYLIVRPLLQSR